LEVVPPNFKWIKRIWDPVYPIGGGYFGIAAWDSENPLSSIIWRYNLQKAEVCYIAGRNSFNLMVKMKTPATGR
jgi:hypothetical protein